MGVLQEIYRYMKLMSSLKCKTSSYLNSRIVQIIVFNSFVVALSCTRVRRDLAAGGVSVRLSICHTLVLTQN